MLTTSVASTLKTNDAKTKITLSSRIVLCIRCYEDRRVAPKMKHTLCFFVAQIAKVLRPFREYTAQWNCPGSYVSSTRDEVHLFITLSVLGEIFLIFNFYSTV